MFCPKLRALFSGRVCVAIRALSGNGGHSRREQQGA